MHAVGYKILRDRREYYEDVKENVMLAHEFMESFGCAPAKMVKINDPAPIRILIAEEPQSLANYAPNQSIHVFQGKQTFEVFGNAILVYADEDYKKMGLGDPTALSAVKLRHLSFRKECVAYEPEKMLDIVGKTISEISEDNDKKATLCAKLKNKEVALDKELKSTKAKLRAELKNKQAALDEAKLRAELKNKQAALDEEREETRKQGDALKNLAEGLLTSKQKKLHQKIEQLNSIIKDKDALISSLRSKVRAFKTPKTKHQAAGKENLKGEWEKRSEAVKKNCVRGRSGGKRKRVAQDCPTSAPRAVKPRRSAKKLKR